MNQPIVKPFSISSMRGECIEYDAFFSTVGFETRARAVAEAFRPRARRLIACAFPDRKELSYEENLAWFSQAGYTVDERSDVLFKPWFREMILSIQKDEVNQYKIAIDVSSTSRLRLAIMVDVLRGMRQLRPMAVDFLYSIARFSPPIIADVPNVHVGPVLKSFAGWSLNPDQPAVAVVGLGYEENKALGAVEHLQASQVWAFSPTSPVPEYDEALESANQIFFDSLPVGSRIPYRVEQPFECFVALESLTERCLRSSGVVLLPFGPKIFAVCALLVACVHESAAVWRVSAGGLEPAVDRVASEYICGLSALLT